MAAFDTTRPFTAVGTSGRIAGVLASLLNAVISWNDVRLTRKSLSMLSDRELDDIGLTRTDIDRVSENF